MSGQEQDKTEEPTPFRLEDARKKGEVAKSPDVAGVLVMAAFAVSVAVMAGSIGVAVMDAVGRTLLLAGAGPVIDTGLWHWVLKVYTPVGQALLPALMAMVIAGVVGTLLQTGFVFSTEPLKPKFERMNPSNAFERLFSLRTLWDFGKLTLKMLGLGILLWSFMLYADQWSEGVARANPKDVPSLLATAFMWASVATLALLALLALMDYFFANAEYIRKLRMSRRELKDENKQREGDPEVRAKQKRNMRELIKKLAAVGQVKDADIVLTNPTHVAVALRYRPKTMRAPEVIAKGQGFLSARIRKTAARHGVRVERHPALARALYAEVDIGAGVPELLYAQLAPIYRQLMSEPGNRVNA